MRVTILHLTDIHFSDDQNPIRLRAKSIADAVAGLDPSPEVVLIAISGDVANSGQPREYSDASAFISELASNIRNLNNAVQITIATVPGNHDCILPDSGAVLRRALVNGIEPSIESAQPDTEVLNQLLSAQSAYFDFQEAVTSSKCPGQDRLCQTLLITSADFRIQLNLYNTALLSQRPEVQGALRVPVDIFDVRIRPLDGADLSIAILHHTYLWLESNNSIRFRRHIDDTADLVLSGHQHVDHAFVKEGLSGARALYLEGACLHDPRKPEESGFNIIEIDSLARQQRVTHFKWSQDHYSGTRTKDWSTLVGNRASRHQFRITAAFQNFLDDPGAGYTHARKRQITLRDIFVYPDLAVRKTLTKPNTTEVSAEGFHEFLRASDHVIFEGEAQSGRTALAKIIYSDLLNILGHVPVFVDGQDLKPMSEDAFTRRISKEVERQYGHELTERFHQLDRSKRALMIDDWHKSKLSERRTDFLQMADKRFGTILLFSDPIFDIQEFVASAREQTTIKHFQHATVQQFGYRARGHLIEKWLTLGREGDQDTHELVREIDRIEKLVNALLGKNTLPKFPFIILSVLQAYQERQTARAEVGSYGYVYEVLITTALATTANSPSDIDKKYTLLSHLAYRMFRTGAETLAYGEIVKVTEEYLKEYGLRGSADALLDDLIRARVLSVHDGNYRFQYSYYVEYFVARYYKDALQNPSEKTKALENELFDMACHVSWERYSKILMFFLYFTRNSDLIALLIANASEVFGTFAPATLDKDIEFANALYRNAPQPTLPNGSVRENREARRKRLDENQKSLPQEDGGKKIKYSEDLNIGDKLDIATKYLELLGQIIRNFPGSLRAEAKHNIAQCAYLLGLRIIAALLDALGSAVSQYREVLKQPSGTTGKNPNEHPRDIEEMADKLFLLLTRVGVLGLIKRISFSVGSPELDQTYADVLDTLPDSNAVHLVDLAIRLDHLLGFPEGKVQTLQDRTHTSIFAHQILTDLVIEHMTLFEVDYRLRQRIGQLLGFKASHPRIVAHRPKLLKGGTKPADD